MDIKFGQHFVLNPPLIEDVDQYSLKATHRVATQCLSNIEDEMLQIIIDEVRKEGYTDLYILNRDFIMAAIREKLERDGEHGSAQV